MVLNPEDYSTTTTTTMKTQHTQISLSFPLMLLQQIKVTTLLRHLPASATLPTVNEG
jgi:hypothetical protein